MVEAAYGEGVADLFIAAVPPAIVALVAVALLREVPLGTRSGTQQLAEQERARQPADRVAAQSVGESAEEASVDAAGLPWEAVGPELEAAYQPAAGSPKRSRSAEETRSR